MFLQWHSYRTPVIMLVAGIPSVTYSILVFIYSCCDLQFFVSPCILVFLQHIKEVEYNITSIAVKLVFISNDFVSWGSNRNQHHGQSHTVMLKDSASSRQNKGFIMHTHKKSSCNICQIYKKTQTMKIFSEKRFTIFIKFPLTQQFTKLSVFLREFGGFRHRC